MKYKLLLGTTMFSLAFSGAFAQSAQELAKKKMIDSLKSAALDAYAMKYPLLRQGMIATDFMGKGNVKGELHGKDLYEGKVNVTRIRSNFKIPVSQWGKNAITATVSYQQQRFETTDVTNYNPQYPVTARNITKSTAGFTASYSRADSIFNIPVIFSGSITGITDELSSIKRMNYSGVITVPIKRSQYNALTVGLVAIIDPSAVSPVIPVVSYWHKYQSSDLELFVDLPSRIALRKQWSKRSWTSFGTELGGSLMFFDLDQPALPQNTIYSTLDIRSGASFEYLLTKKVIFGINAGLNTTSNARLFDRRDKPTDYFFKNKVGTVPYIGFSISVLPFLKQL